jgi:hypothetical protein
MTEKGWHRAFDDPIPLPDGSELRILCDEGNYIAKLPKKDHDAPAWQAAMQALMLVAARGATSCCRGSASRGRSIRAT